MCWIQNSKYGFWLVFILEALYTGVYGQTKIKKAKSNHHQHTFIYSCSQIWLTTQFNTQDTTSFPRWSNIPLWLLYDLIHIKQAQLHAKGIAGSLGEQAFKKLCFLITMIYIYVHSKTWLLFKFFIKVVVNEQEYSFLLISMMFLQ